MKRTHIIAATVGLSLALTGMAKAAVLTSYSTDLPADVFTAPTSSSKTVFVQGTISGQYISPFADTTSEYVVVKAGGSAIYDISGTSLSFVYGSPDSYNTISFLNASGDVFDTFTPAGSPLTAAHSYFVTLTASGEFSAVEFSSSGNSLEFSNVSAVPLPAAAPMFGAALLALAGLGCGAKRKRAAAAA